MGHINRWWQEKRKRKEYEDSMAQSALFWGSCFFPLYLYWISACLLSCSCSFLSFMCTAFIFSCLGRVVLLIPFSRRCCFPPLFLLPLSVGPASMIAFLISFLLPDHAAAPLLCVAVVWSDGGVWLGRRSAYAPQSRPSRAPPIRREHCRPACINRSI